MYGVPYNPTTQMPAPMYGPPLNGTPSVSVTPMPLPKYGPSPVPTGIVHGQLSPEAFAAAIVVAVFVLVCAIIGLRYFLGHRK